MDSQRRLPSLLPGLKLLGFDWKPKVHVLLFTVTLYYISSLCVALVDVTITPKSVSVAQGQDVVFECIVHRTDNDHCSWLLLVDFYDGQGHTFHDPTCTNVSRFRFTSYKNSTVECSPVGVEHFVANNKATLLVQGQEI